MKTAINLLLGVVLLVAPALSFADSQVTRMVSQISAVCLADWTRVRTPE